MSEGENHSSPLKMKKAGFMLSAGMDMAIEITETRPKIQFRVSTLDAIIIEETTIKHL
jgi:hypothetical protein